MELTYRLDLEPSLSVSSRRRQLRRNLKKRLAAWNPISTESSEDLICAAWHVSELGQALEALTDADHAAEKFLREPLEPKIVKELLNITGTELRRWTKDGRLPRSGIGQFKKGRQVFQYTRYNANGIAQLAKQPEIILAWRMEDDACQGSGPL